MQFKLGCQTLPWSELPLQRALEGVARAGYPYVCYGTTHEKQPSVDPEWSDAETLELRQRTEDLGLTPVMVFMPSGGVSAEGGVDRVKRALEQAKLLSVDCMLAWGPWEYEVWPGKKYGLSVWREMTDAWFKLMEPVAAHAEAVGLMITLKPHTGVTAYGNVLRATIERIGSPMVQACYDGGNVSFYEGLDPALDIKDCLDLVKALCVKDHAGPRANPSFPVPGTGDVDHPAMLRLMCEQGFNGPVVVERFEGPFKKTEMAPELIDALAAHTCTYLKGVMAEG